MTYQCEECQKSYTRLQDLKRHIKDKHIVEHTTLDKMNSRPEEEVFGGFIHPFTMLVAGPTGCGKSTFLAKLLEQSQLRIRPPPYRVIWCYKRWQPLYTKMQETIPGIEFVQGLPSGIQDEDFLDNRYPTLIVFDDLMKDATSSSQVCELFTEGSHHRNLSVICLVQNLFYQNKESRTLSLNTQYLVVFKNPRDQQQVSVLASQMYPGKSGQFLQKFREATQPPFGYLLVDLKQETPENKRLKANIFGITTQPFCASREQPPHDEEEPYPDKMETMESGAESKRYIEWRDQDL